MPELRFSVFGLRFAIVGQTGARSAYSYSHTGRPSIDPGLMVIRGRG